MPIIAEKEIKMQKQTVTIIPTEDPNVDIIDVQTNDIQFQKVTDLLEYIRQDEIKCAMEIAKRKYLRSHKQPEESIIHKMVRRVAVACL